MRQFAKEAYMRVDASQRIRKAMLRKSMPMRGPYNVGDLVSFSRKGRWFGPARVLGHEGKSSLWLVHSGVCVLVAETLVRPATSQEVLKKQLLELRPSRQRRRTIYQDDDQDDKIPFSEDTMTAGALREPHHQHPVPFVDARPAAGDDVLFVKLKWIWPLNLVQCHPGHLMQCLPLQLNILQCNHNRIFDDVPDEPMVELPQSLEVRPPPGLALPQDGTASAQSLPQPEPEVAPLLTPRPPGQEAASELNPAMENSTLTQSLRRSAETLDGIPISRRQTSDSFLASKAERKYKKKTQKVGAGMELHYQRETAEIQAQLQETMKKEWSNWKRYSDGRWITQNDLDQLRMQNPNLKIIPTRWVHTNKAEPNQPMKLKSRLVVRGDLEDSSSMRCDSPTASQAAMGLVFVLSATRNTDLHCGDISAAFLQGSKLDRILVLSVPKNEGIPGVETEGMYYLVSSTAYGTKDAPRGWFKNLDATVKGKKFIPLAHEPAAYMLQNDDGSLAGLLVVHVDDLLWTGGTYIEKVMEEIQTKYNFGKTSVNRFTYCGREVVKDSTGVHITCPSLMDRVRPIFLTPEQKKSGNKEVDEKLRGQLRSVIGSLAWYARVCRPDLSYAVCKLQSSVHAATINDVKYANKVIELAKRDQNKGISYPCGTMKFEEAMIVAIQDASHAADYDTSESGQKLGHRSQSGRLLCLAAPDFREKQQGQLLLLEWHSTIIKRVCRSTLQAETLSLLLGSEEAEHLRMVLYATKDPAIRRPGWIIDAQDSVLVDWYTDCRSLYQYINQEGLHSVSDKRLAIDLSAIRQQTWRRAGEEFGDPLLTDKVPADGATRILWTTTDRMLADPLTKGMRHVGLEKLMCGSEVFAAGAAATMLAPSFVAPTKLNVVTSAPAPVASAAPTSGVGASASVVGAGAAALAAAATVRPSKRCAKKEKVVRMATATEVDVDTECINAIRFLAVDAVNKANSGHPGAPMGQAPIGYLLFAEEMQYNPEDPKWVNRDRFVLSSGHGCMLQYSLLHLAGYKSVSIDDIKQFRQWGSKTPGHPENFETEGIEVTTGPLGMGISNAVGLAAAEAHLAAVYNKPGMELIDHYTYTIAGDGCMQEGISHEACAYAGHLGLGKLIAFYDDNGITIDGHTDLSFTEDDVGKRFEGYGWQVLEVPEGNTDVDAIRKAIKEAKACTDKPTLIKVKTTIGFGSPNKADSHDAHGAPLGADEAEATRAQLGWNYGEFEVPEQVYDTFSKHAKAGAEKQAAWEKMWKAP
eukprot:s840_g35.t1